MRDEVVVDAVGSSVGNARGLVSEEDSTLEVVGVGRLIDNDDGVSSEEDPAAGNVVFVAVGSTGSALLAGSVLATRRGTLSFFFFAACGMAVDPRFCGGCI